MHGLQLTDLNTIERFLFAGKATATVVSKKTGTRFTFKVQTPKDNDNRWFVNVLTGPNNAWNGDWKYLGFVDEHGRFMAGVKGRPAAVSFKAFAFLARAIMETNEEAMNKMELWHDGRCGSCGRKLTVPESIETGLGPICAGK